MSKNNLEVILHSQRAAFNANPNSSWADRKSKLIKLGEVINANEQKFQKVISEDFGNRSFTETTVAEVAIIHGGIKHALKHTQKWMRTRKAPTALQFKPAANKIIPQPLGVIGIISP